MIKKSAYCVDDLRCPRYNICKGECQNSDNGKKKN